MKISFKYKKIISFAIILPFVSCVFSNDLLSSKISLINNNYSSNYDDNEINNNSNYSVEQVSAGENYSAAIVNDGINSFLYTWGNNSYGQLGYQTEGTYSKVPQKVIFPIEGDVEQISMSKNYSLAVLNDGSNDYLYSWGINDKGQLGLGNKISYSTPQKVTKLPEGNIEQISAGGGHAAAVIEEGGSNSLYTWGDNSNSLYTWDDNSNSLYIWGDNNKGQLGLGDTTNYSTPQKVEKTPNNNWLNPSLDQGLPLGDIKQISMGGTYYSAAIIQEEDGKDHLYTWGDNRYDQLGIGFLRWEVDQMDQKLEYFMVPQEITALPDGEIKQISLGKQHSAAVVKNETGNHLYTWGQNAHGQLGLGKWEDIDIPRPLLVKDLPEGEIEQISMGDIHSSAVVNDGKEDHLYTWGGNRYGQLGLGNNIEYNTPQEVTGLPKGEIKQISLGNNFSIAIVNDGTVENPCNHLYAWGANDYGQLGYGDNYKRKAKYDEGTVYYDSPHQVFPIIENQWFFNNWYYFLLLLLVIFLLYIMFVVWIIKTRKTSKTIKQ